MVRTGNRTRPAKFHWRACWILLSCSCELVLCQPTDIQRNERVVENVASFVEERLKLPEIDCECSLHRCSRKSDSLQCEEYDTGQVSACDGGEGTPPCSDWEVDFTQSRFVTPFPINNNLGLGPHEQVKWDVCRFQGLEKAIDEWDTKVNGLISWTYFGTLSGTQRTFPAAPVCQEFDPRVRPWFKTSFRVPMNLVILLENSDIMMMGTRNLERSTKLYEKGRDIVRGLLDTLLTRIQGEKFNIVLYNNEARALMGDQVVVANDASIKEAKDRLGDASALPEGNVSDLGKGIDKAIELFDKKDGCAKVIVIITSDNGDCSLDAHEGKECSIIAEEGRGRQALLDHIDRKKAELDPGGNLAIFPVSLVSHQLPGADSGLSEQISCRNKGVWAKVDARDDVLHQLKGYYQALALPFGGSKIVWSENYTDAFGLGCIVTIAKAIYDEEGLLEGVIGRDVRFTGEVAFTRETEKTSAFRTCPGIPVTDCQLQRIRKTQPCPKRQQQAPGRNCYKLGDTYYDVLWNKDTNSGTLETYGKAESWCSELGGELVNPDIGGLDAMVMLAAEDGSWIKRVEGDIDCYVVEPRVTEKKVKRFCKKKASVICQFHSGMKPNSCKDAIDLDAAVDPECEFSKATNTIQKLSVRPNNSMPVCEFGELAQETNTCCGHESNDDQFGLKVGAGAGSTIFGVFLLVLLFSLVYRWYKRLPDDAVPKSPSVNNNRMSIPYSIPPVHRHDFRVPGVVRYGQGLSTLSPFHSPPSPPNGSVRFEQVVPTTVETLDIHVHEERPVPESPLPVTPQLTTGLSTERDRNVFQYAPGPSGLSPFHNPPSLPSGSVRFEDVVPAPVQTLATHVEENRPIPTSPLPSTPRVTTGPSHEWTVEGDSLPNLRSDLSLQFKNLASLGSGTFGRVQQGVFVDESDEVHMVAIKFAKSAAAGRMLAKELEIFREVPPHPNIIKCFGAKIPETDLDDLNLVLDEVYLVEELMHHSLQDVLCNEECSARLPYARIVKIALSIAKGLDHLHQYRIIHYDLKPGNILLDESLTNVKITDFGSSMYKLKSQMTPKQAGTPGYIAPEIWRCGFVRDLKFNEKADVYSFGVILREMIMECHPKHVKRTSAREINPYQVQFNDECPEKLRFLVDECTEVEAKNRPRMEDIVNVLQELTRTMGWNNFSRRAIGLPDS